MQKVLQSGEKEKHTASKIPRLSPTLVLITQYRACVWQSGRCPAADASADRSPVATRNSTPSLLESADASKRSDIVAYFCDSNVRWRHDIPGEVEGRSILNLARALDTMIGASKDVVWLPESSSYAVGDNERNHICLEQACLHSKGTQFPRLAAVNIGQRLAERGTVARTKVGEQKHSRMRLNILERWYKTPTITIPAT